MSTSAYIPSSRAFRLETVSWAEAPRQIRPEIDGFKGRDRVKPVIRKHHIRHAALQDGTAALRDGGLVDLFGFLYADGWIVDALHDTLWAFFKQPSDIRPAAAAVQYCGIRRKLQKPKPPPRHRTVTQIHHGDHELPTKANRLAGVFKERHIKSYYVKGGFSHLIHMTAAHLW